jgi:GGDEF domain-containing protein
VSEYLGRIDFLADHDPLTLLPNRRSFHKRLSASLASGRTGVVVMLDMDNFKAINDTLGHVFGDGLLKQIADRLAGTAGDGAFVSRFGGDEFLLLYEYNTSDALDGYIAPCGICSRSRWRLRACASAWNSAWAWRGIRGQHTVRNPHHVLGFGHVRGEEGRQEQVSFLRGGHGLPCPFPPGDETDARGSPVPGRIPVGVPAAGAAVRRHRHRL